MSSILEGPRYATLTGLAVGDALGMPFEMKPSDSRLLREWEGDFQDSHSPITTDLKAGQWTDDTKMALALSRSLLAEETYSPAGAARGYLEWFNSKDWRGIGLTTNRALTRLRTGLPWTQSGIEGSEGNGTAMRVAPLGLLFRTNLQAAAEMAAIDAEITHRSVEARYGSIAIAVAVALLVQGTVAKEDVVLKVLEWVGESKLQKQLQRAQFFLGAPRESLLKRLIELGTSPHVVRTVPAALYAFAATNSFAEAVELAIRAGGDTDTTGAITGALAGTWYGIEQVAPYADKLEAFNYLRYLEICLHNSAKELAPVYEEEG